VSWIRTVNPQDARGPLREIYDAAVRRAGRVFGILRVQSANPDALTSSLELYKTLMHGPSPLSRREREMLAVVVSGANRCHY
jgi:alkylhydroperoxidase family enzyme